MTEPTCKAASPTPSLSAGGTQEARLALSQRCHDCYEFGHEECGCGECGNPRCGTAATCPANTPEPHLLGEFSMTCYRCHLEADS